MMGAMTSALTVASRTRLVGVMIFPLEWVEEDVKVFMASLPEDVGIHVERGRALAYSRHLSCWERIARRPAV